MTLCDASNSESPIPQYAHSGNVSEQLYLERRSSRVEAAFLLPYLKPNLEVLDCGCGPGTITLGLAEIVSPGRVIGIDMEEAQIERARELAYERDLSDVEFQVGNIYELQFPDGCFDVVFANAVFEHLSDPLKALAEVHRVLKTGGLVALRDADLDLVTTAGPHEELLRRSTIIMAEQWKHVSGDPYLGRNLRSLLNRAGFINCAATSTAENFGTIETTRWFGEFMARYFDDTNVLARVIELGLATNNELAMMKDAWLVWGESSDSFGTVLWCEATGWKR